MTRKRIDDSAEVSIIMPPEERWEYRVERGHTQSEWRFKLVWYNHRCAYCGISARETPEGYLTRDHLIPICEGGTDVIENIVPACKTCNFKKGAQAAEKTVGKPKVRKRRKSK